MMDSGLTVVSTTNKLFNSSLYKQLTDESLVRPSCLQALIFTAFLLLVKDKEHGENMVT